MVRIWAPLPANIVERDKQFHFKAGCIISLVVGVLALIFGAPGFYPALLGVVAAVIAGLLKEAWDVVKPNPTGFDFMDFKATMLGSLPSALLVLGISGMAQML